MTARWRSRALAAVGRWWAGARGLDVARPLASQVLGGLPGGGAGTIWVIATPGCLDLLEPCVKLARAGAPTTIVDNGLSEVERRRVGERLPGVPVLRLPTLGGAVWRHGTVLTLLLTEAGGPLGLVDADCFVTDERLLAPPDLELDEMVACLDLDGFRTRHPETDLVFPRTHFLWCNPAALGGIMARHRIGCAPYRRPPRRLRPTLAGVGLRNGVFPSPHLPFYDTLQLVLATGLAEGLRVRWTPAPLGSVTHFGGASRKLRARDGGPGPSREGGGC